MPVLIDQAERRLPRVEFTLFRILPDFPRRKRTVPNAKGQAVMVGYDVSDARKWMTDNRSRLNYDPATGTFRLTELRLRRAPGQTRP